MKCGVITDEDWRDHWGQLSCTKLKRLKMNILRPRVCLLLLTLLSAYTPVQAEPGSDIAPKIEIKPFWNLRYSQVAELQTGNAGLSDLYVPLLAGDEVIERTAPTENDSDKTQQPLAPIKLKGPLRPAVVVVHGGGWLAGDKWGLGTHCEKLAQLGICVLNINYRLAPYAKFPAQVDDVREAILYLSDHAEELCIDRTRIGLFGYSAGGHLSALVGVMTDETTETQASASAWPLDDSRWSRMPRIAAVCAGGPPCDLRVLPIDSEALSFFLNGTRRQIPEIYTAASPTAHVSAGDPPMQLIHGAKDLIVPIESSQQFAAALEGVGVAVALTVIENQGHLVTFMHPTTLTQVSKFFSETLLK
jgi:triacylglycerol lipase